MKKFLTFLTISVLATASLTACDSGPSEDAQTVINKAWEKLADKNASYTKGHIAVEGKASLEVEDSSGSISGSADVMFDSEDLENAKSAVKMDLKAKGNFSGSEGEVSLKGELRNFIDKTHVYIENLDIDTGDPQTNLMANVVGNLYKSQWVAFPTETFKPTDVPALEADRFRGKEVAEIAKKNNFFEVKKELGKGKYELTINPDKLKTYLSEVSKVTENPITEAELKDIDDIFAELEYTLTTKIDSDYEITWVKGDISAEDPREDQKMTLTFEGELDDDESEGFFDLQLTGETPGKLRVDFEAEHKGDAKVSIEVPEDSQDFDLSGLLGGGLGAGLGGGAPGLPGLASEEPVGNVE